MSRIVMNIASIVLIARDPSFINGSYILLSNNVSPPKYFRCYLSYYIDSHVYSTWQSSESSLPPSGHGARTGTNMTPQIRSQARGSTPAKPTITVHLTLRQYKPPRYPHSTSEMPTGQGNLSLTRVRPHRCLRVPNLGHGKRRKRSPTTSRRM